MRHRVSLLWTLLTEPNRLGDGVSRNPIGGLGHGEEKRGRMSKQVWSAFRLTAAALTVLAAFSTAPAWAGNELNPDADEILRAMSTFMRGAKTLSVAAEVSNEIITRDGEKLQWNSSAKVLLRRPAGYHATLHSRFGDAELYFDGKQLVLYGKSANAYLQKEVDGGNDAFFAAIEGELGLNLPGVDLLAADPYAALAPGVTRSGYHGVAYVSGVECHHLSFREDEVDWQIWVKTGKEPLPLKYVITTKWLTGAPQYTVQLHDWNLAPAVPAGPFSFSPPPEAVKWESLPVDEAGELVLGGVNK